MRDGDGGVARVLVVHFPSRTATALAQHAYERLVSRGVGAALAECADAVVAGDRDHLVLVFPIVGDERIPGPMHDWITRNARPATHAVCVTGDFRTGQRSNPVSDEADRLLRVNGSRPVAPPILLDTPLVVADIVGRVGMWLDRHQGAAAGDLDRPASPDPVSAARLPREDVEDALHGIVRRLGRVPVVRFDGDGRCTHLSLRTASAYPRSLLDGASLELVSEILERCAELPALLLLGLPFAGLTVLPAPLPEHLLRLDLRGNPLRSFAPLLSSPAMQALNLAGCDLHVVPDEVSTLYDLDTLVLAKNRLRDLPSALAELSGLQRLTVYRNAMKQVPSVVARLGGLRLLNLGANAISDLPATLAGLHQLEVLGLRLLPVSAVPTVLAQLPRLRAVDVSKTPLASSNALQALGVEPLDGMPPWAWDEAAEPLSVR